MTALTESKTNGKIARPLKVLVPLIKDDLKHASEAAQQASLPYERAAGEKLIEAKSQMKHGEFVSWVERNFSVKIRQAQRYMALAEHLEKRPASRFSSLSEFIRETSDPNYNLPHTVRPQTWHEPVKQVINKVNVDKLAEERQSREKETKLIRELAMQLIDIGYKALATKLHPDRGGSSEAMVRLNKVRDILKRAV